MNNKYPAGYIPMTHHEQNGGSSQNNNYRGGSSNSNSRPERPRRNQQNSDFREPNMENRNRARIPGRRIG